MRSVFIHVLPLYFLSFSLFGANELGVQESYSLVVDAYEAKSWKRLIDQCQFLLSAYPNTPFAEEALYYEGVAYFHLEEFDKASRKLSQYLERKGNPKFFEEAIGYKLSIAEKFRSGAKKHLFNWDTMPKWLPAKEDAIAIYDTVITSLPHHGLAAQALYGKALILFDFEDYRSSLETLDTLIRRFPKHELAIEGFLQVANTYLHQCKVQHLDPNLLDLARVNIKKFAMSFPGEERVAQAELMLGEMEEIYASDFYETGRFFERTKKIPAALIYYQKVVVKFPETIAAQSSQKRLDVLQKDSSQE